LLFLSLKSKKCCIFAADIEERTMCMCKYNVAIDDAVMRDVRPTITEGMDEDAWVQLQVKTLFAKMAEEARSKKKGLSLSQRLRGIGHAPKDFDYKKELEDRF
jgi:hypothetical protein